MSVTELENSLERMSTTNDIPTEKELMDIIRGLESLVEKLSIADAQQNFESLKQSIRKHFQTPVIVVNNKIVEEIKLTDEQQKIYDEVVAKLGNLENDPLYLYVCGPAGTGKSVLLSELYKKINRRFENGCKIVAPTGIAALNVDGSTVHSVFKLDPYGTTYDENPFAFDMNTKVIIIDEISMVDATLFARIDNRLKTKFNNDEPFGGCSIIVFGDLMQLEPVFDKTNKSFVFQEIPSNTPFHNGLKNQLWNLFKFAELTDNRRTTDVKEANVLKLIRTGEYEDAKNDNFFENKQCLKDLPAFIDEGDAAFKKFKELRTDANNLIILAATNEIVDFINLQGLFELPGDAYLYKKQKIPYAHYARVVSNDIEHLRVKIGSPVMLTCNIDVKRGLVNGLIGKVSNCEEDGITVSFPSIGNDVKIERQNWQKNGKGPIYAQFPLRLATAITIHKSQGITVDSVLFVTADLFANNHFYTAISRAKSLKNSWITRYRDDMIKTSGESRAEIDRMRTEAALFELAPVME